LFTGGAIKIIKIGLIGKMFYTVFAERLMFARGRSSLEKGKQDFPKKQRLISHKAKAIRKGAPWQ
jgi:hypothetical protein